MQNKTKVTTYNFRVDGVRLLAERYDTKSNVKLVGFQSQLQASNVSSHTEELWYNETVCLWLTIYIYIYIYIYIDVDQQEERKKVLFTILNTIIRRPQQKHKSWNFIPEHFKYCDKNVITIKPERGDVFKAASIKTTKTIHITNSTTKNAARELRNHLNIIIKNWQNKYFCSTW